MAEEATVSQAENSTSVAVSQPDASVKPVKPSEVPYAEVQEEAEEGPEEVKVVKTDEVVTEGSQAKADDIPAELAEQAKELGYSDDEIRDLGQKRLEKVLSVVASKKNPDAATEQHEQQEVADEFKLELNADEYDEGLIKQFNALHEYHNKRYSALEQQVREFAQERTRKQVEKFESDFDDAISELGAGYKDLLGEGRTRSIDKKSQEHSNRVKLLTRMESIAGEYVRLGQNPPSTTDLLNEAVRSVFSDKADSIARRRIATTLDARQGHVLARSATRAGSKGATPEASAVAAVKSFFEAKGEL